jgi:hypothetical protein
MREEMPFLLTESLGRERRELTHRHIEMCPACSAEWSEYENAWRLMGELPEQRVPERVKERFLAGIGQSVTRLDDRRRRLSSTRKWMAQAAAVVIIAGGAYYAGHREPLRIESGPARIESVQRVPFSIAESRVLPASAVSPTIEGRPNIQNLSFVDPDPTDNKVDVSFDVTSRITVSGSPKDESMVRLLSYVLEDESGQAPSRSRTMDWVKQTYSDPNNASAEIASALAKVLRTDSHEGVRLRAAETLKTLPPSFAAETREALMDALKNDPNPAVRIKVVEALANLARSGSAFDPAIVDTLRQKASQDDENLYVRVKAAEVLSSMRPQ